MAAIPIEGLYKNDLTNDDKNTIQQRLKERIPTGARWYQSPLPETKQTLERIASEVEPTNLLKGKLTEQRVQNQLGTLGGGNHFLEVVHDEDTEQVWILLHSDHRRTTRVRRLVDFLASEIRKRRALIEGRTSSD